MRALGLLALLALASLAAPAAGDLAASLKYISTRNATYVEELRELVAIPSVSALSVHVPDILKAAEWVKARLERAGLKDAQILPTNGPRPVVYAQYTSPDPAAKTVLIYGHYDVQPAEPLELWDTPPFELHARNGKLYGRGASDDKAGVLLSTQALEAVLASGGLSKLNVKVLFEGEEEVLSSFLKDFLLKHKTLLACDFAVSADGGQISERQSSMTLGYRGAAGVEIAVSALSHDVHSGMAGGAVQNPARALAALLSTLHERDGKVAVPGFYDDVRPASAEDRDDILATNYDDHQELEVELGAVEPWGESGFSSLERIWLRPTLEVVGLVSGHTGEGMKTIIPARASAKLAARLVPDQDPEKIIGLIERHIAAHHTPAANVTVREMGFMAHPYLTRRDTLPNSIAAGVLERVMGTPPRFQRSGATIPALALFQTILGVDTTTFAFSTTSDLLHAPNEHVIAGMFHAGREAFVRLLHAYDGIDLPAPHDEL